MNPKPIQRINLKTQVKNDLVAYIEKLDLRHSTKLPREEELSVMLGVSRVTLRSVLDELAGEGLIFRRQGRGTFVNLAFFEIKVTFNPVKHFSDMIRESGFVPRTELLYNRYEPVSDEVSRALQIQVGSSVLVSARIFYADNNICVKAVDYIPATVIPEKEIEKINLFEDSIFYFIHLITGRKIAFDKVEIDTASSKTIPEFHQHLKDHGQKDKSLLLLKGVNYDEGGVEIMYAKEYIDSSIIKFNLIRKRNIRYE